MRRHPFIILLVALCAVSCVSKPPVATVVHLPPRARILVPDAPDGPVKVDVSLATKTAQLLTSHGELLAEMDISPGMAGHETPCGQFRVIEKLPLKRSNLYGQYVTPDTREVVVAKHWEHQGPKPPGTVYQGIAMPFWMRLTADGVGMHVGGFERGQPSSKGCIRCPEEGQRYFYQHCRVGTPVRVHTGIHPGAAGGVAGGGFAGGSAGGQEDAGGASGGVGRADGGVWFWKNGVAGSAAGGAGTDAIGTGRAGNHR